MNTIFLTSASVWLKICKIVSNKAKGQISERVFQENKARHISRKRTNKRNETKEMFVFRKNWRALFSWNTRFEICLFALLPTIFAFICSVKWKEKILNTYTLVQSAMIINFSGNFLVLFFYSNFVKWNIALMEKFKLTNKDENYSTIFI